MLQRLLLSGSIVTLLLFAGCQNYTSGLQQSVTRADETTVITSLKAIGLAQRTYSLSNAGEYGTLQQLTDGGFLDARFARPNPIKDYVFTMNVVPKASNAPEGSFTCTADPQQPNERGGRHFYIDSTSTNIHVNDTQTATAKDKTLN
jgi:hypothetical protein